MSSHADTIRRYIDSNRAHGKVNAFSYTSLPLDDLDALLDENQRLREALGWLERTHRSDTNRYIHEGIVRALAGDTE